MAFRLEFSADAERDFDLIFDHLLENYVRFGESTECAIEHAAARILEIRAAANRILTAPHRGARHDDIPPGLRHVAIDRAIHWFDIDDPAGTVRILAVFFGGQDHVRRMLSRLLGT